MAIDRNFKDTGGIQAFLIRHISRAKVSNLIYISHYTLHKLS